jgi:hypothetical protein
MLIKSLGSSTVKDCDSLHLPPSLIFFIPEAGGIDDSLQESIQVPEDASPNLQLLLDQEWKMHQNLF